jgi:hypothetical protein
MIAARSPRAWLRPRSPRVDETAAAGPFFPCRIAAPPAQPSPLPRQPCPTRRCPAGRATPPPTAPLPRVLHAPRGTAGRRQPRQATGDRQRDCDRHPDDRLAACAYCCLLLGRALQNELRVNCLTTQALLCGDRQRATARLPAAAAPIAARAVTANATAPDASIGWRTCGGGRDSCGGGCPPPPAPEPSEQPSRGPQRLPSGGLGCCCSGGSDVSRWAPEEAQGVGWLAGEARHTRPGAPAAQPSSRHTRPTDHSTPAAAATTSPPSGGRTHRARPSSSSRVFASSLPSHPPPRRRRPKGTCAHAWRGMEEGGGPCQMFCAHKEECVRCPGAERRMQAAAAARVLNAVRTPCPPRAGGRGQLIQASCAKSGMLAGKLGAAQEENFNHERNKTRKNLECRKQMKRLAAAKELQIFRQQLERTQHFLFFAPAPSCMAPNVFPASVVCIARGFLVAAKAAKRAEPQKDLHQSKNDLNLSKLIDSDLRSSHCSSCRILLPEQASHAFPQKPIEEQRQSVYPDINSNADRQRKCFQY